MALCELCKAFRSEDLPPFPEKAMKSVSGLRYFHQAFLRESVDTIGPKHQPDLASLRSAAAAGCGLCQLIAKEADAVLAEYNNMGAETRGNHYPEPKFDLYLTKLTTGRPGFMASTSSIDERHGRKALIPVAAIGFCAEQDGVSSQFTAARPVPEVPNQDLLDRLVHWVQDCDKHVACVRKGGPAPARLVHVGAAEDDTLRIVSEADENVDRYIALSHSYKHADISNCDLPPASQTHIELSALPKAFQDAVTITRILGVKYLWIDELCVAREDVQDWARDSKNMGAVFTNAYLTLAATGVADTAAGLLFPRTAREYKPFDYTTPDGQHDQLQAFTAPLDREFIESYYIRMRSEPMSKDLWAFQDRVLSSRTLHFASDQIYLECQEAFTSEDGLRLGHSSTAPYTRFGDIPRSPQNPGMETWSSVLCNYGNCSVDTAADRLAGMANVARAYADVWQDEYIAGLWKNSTLEQLCWQGLKRRTIENTGMPSWSWASFEGITALMHGKQGRRWEPHATVLKHHFEYQGSDPFGPIKEAWIEMEATLIPLEVAEKNAPSSHIFLRRKDGGDERIYAGLDSLDREYDVSAAVLKEMELFCLVVGVTHPSPERLAECEDWKCRPGTTCRGLLVTPDGDHGSMRRLGFVLGSPEKFGYKVSDLRARVILK